MPQTRQNPDKKQPPPNNQLGSGKYHPDAASAELPGKRGEHQIRSADQGCCCEADGRIHVIGCGDSRARTDRDILTKLLDPLQVKTLDLGFARNQDAGHHHDRKYPGCDTDSGTDRQFSLSKMRDYKGQSYGGTSHVPGVKPERENQDYCESARNDVPDRETPDL